MKHRDKAATITRERIEWFARYFFMNPSWGVFHVCLDDRNYKLGASEWQREAWSTELVEVVAWFEKLTPSQRSRLGKKARELAVHPFFARWMFAKGLRPISYDGTLADPVHPMATPFDA